MGGEIQTEISIPPLSWMLSEVVSTPVVGHCPCKYCVSGSTGRLNIWNMVQTVFYFFLDGLIRTASMLPISARQHKKWLELKGRGMWLCVRESPVVILPQFLTAAAPATVSE